MERKFRSRYLNKTTGTGPVTFTSVVTDAANNSYLCGYYNGSVTLGSTNLSTSSNNIPLIAKLDPNGNWLWAIDVPNSYIFAGSSSADKIVIDSNNDLIVTGSTYTAATFGAFTVPSHTGNTSAFVAKLDTDGNWLWAVGSANTANGARGRGLALDASDDIYLCGSFSNTSDFGIYSLVALSSSDCFVTKLDSTGSWLWASRAGGSGGASIAYDIKYDGTDFYVGGTFSSSTAAFDAFSISLTGAIDPFLSKIDTSGSWQLATKPVTIAASVSSLVKLAIDSTGLLFCTGVYDNNNIDFGGNVLTPTGSGNAYLASYDTVTDAWVDAYKLSASSFIIPSDISIDTSDRLIMGGRYSGTVTSGPTLPNSINTDGYVAELNASGSYIYTQAARNAGSANIYGIYSRVNKFICACGDFAHGSAPGEVLTFGRGTIAANAGSAGLVINTIPPRNNVS